MGNLILCHDRHAAHPYEISRIHCRIFTIEGPPLDIDERHELLEIQCKEVFEGNEYQV